MGPDSSLTPDLIQAQSFTSSFRGYDASEVRAFLNRVSSELRAWRERADNLESAWHSAEERAARPPVLDEDALMAAVGEETASILRSARQAAAEMRTRAAEETTQTRATAEAEAEAVREEARMSAEQTAAAAKEEAEQALASAQQESQRVLTAARQEAADIVEKAQTDAEETRSKAETDRKLTIEGAHSTRDRILEDLGRRRRVATVQIEQLRAGRERLIESYAVVRRTLEEVQSELSRADVEARAAADDVGRRLRDEPEVELSESSRIMTEPIGPASAEEPEAASEGRQTDAGDSESVTEPVTEAVSDGSPSAAVDDVAVEAETPSEPEHIVVESEANADDSPPLGDLVEKAEPTPEGGSGSAVDELFARIRATRTSAPAPDVQPDGPDIEEAGVEVHELVVAADSGAGSVEGDEDADEDVVLDGDEALLQTRELAVVDLESKLTRRLKRAMQDEQNDVLDRLRNLKGDPTPAQLLPAPDSHVARYHDASLPLLAQAAGAGAGFAADLLHHPEAKGVDVDVEDLARDAGNAIVGPLRRRLEQAMTTSAGEDQAVLIETLGAAYREWKTQRIERLAGDVLSAAFSRGTWEEAPDGTLLRWIVEDQDGPCPDCDDDALAGGIPKSEAFPTGQHHPPAHSGCRCLLVPAAAAD